MLKPRAVSISAVKISSLKELTKIQSLSILGAWGCLIHIAYSRQRAKETADSERARAADRSKVTWAVSWRDHIITKWALENGCVVSSAILREWIIPDSNNAVRFFLGGLFMDRWNMMTQLVVVKYFFSHIPYFAGKSQPTRPLTELASEFLMLFVPVTLLGTWLRERPKVSKKSSASQYGGLMSISPLAFCAKLAIVRTIVDSLFFASLANPILSSIEFLRSNPSKLLIQCHIPPLN